MSPRQRELLAAKATPWAWWIAGIWLVLILAWMSLAIWFVVALWKTFDAIALAIVLSILAGIVLSQAALLFIPVRITTRRPIVRRSLWPGVIAAGFLFALLFLAGVWVTLVAWQGDHAGDMGWEWMTLPAAGALWIGWATFFWIAGRRHDPTSIANRMQEYLIHGSVLELLVAVSAHVISRNRGDCCAQILTLMGIATGVAVALVAFGPAVLILVYRRCQSLRPRGLKVLPAKDPPPGDRI
jgi:NADH:ubiquinone oxidoreductase subunit K